MSKSPMRRRHETALPVPRIIGTRRIFQGWNKLDIVTLEVNDLHGEVRRLEREVVDHGDASVVLMIDPKRRVAIMVRQWRAPLVTTGADPFLLEACAGILDPGETPEEAARREAEEETGIKVSRLRRIGIVVPSAGTLTERVHLFVAEVSAADRTAYRGGNPHEGEDIEVIEMPLLDLFEKARRGEIQDAKTLVIVQQLMLEELQQQRGL